MARERPDPIDERTHRYAPIRRGTRERLGDRTVITHPVDGDVTINGYSIPCLGLPNGMLCAEDGKEYDPEELDVEWEVRERTPDGGR